MLNIRVNKAFGEHITLAFFANNLADLRPTRYSASTRSYLQQNTQPFFGLELQIKLWHHENKHTLHIPTVSPLRLRLPLSSSTQAAIGSTNSATEWLFFVERSLERPAMRRDRNPCPRNREWLAFAGNPPNHIHPLLQITGHGPCENATRPHETLCHPHKRQAPSHESPAYGISSRTDTPTRRMRAMDKRGTKICIYKSSKLVYHGG